MNVTILKPRKPSQPFVFPANKLHYKIGWNWKENKINIIYIIIKLSLPLSREKIPPLLWTFVYPSHPPPILSYGPSLLSHLFFCLLSSVNCELHWLFLSAVHWTSNIIHSNQPVSPTPKLDSANYIRLHSKGSTFFRMLLSSPVSHKKEPLRAWSAYFGICALELYTLIFRLERCNKNHSVHREVRIKNVTNIVSSSSRLTPSTREDRLKIYGI